MAPPLSSYRAVTQHTTPMDAYTESAEKQNKSNCKVVKSYIESNKESTTRSVLAILKTSTISWLVPV